MQAFTRGKRGTDTLVGNLRRICGMTGAAGSTVCRSGGGRAAVRCHRGRRGRSPGGAAGGAGRATGAAAAAACLAVRSISGTAHHVRLLANFP